MGPTSFLTTSHRYRATDTGQLKLYTLSAEEFILAFYSMCCANNLS